MKDRVELQDNDLEQVNGGFEVMPDGNYHFVRGDKYRLKPGTSDIEIHYDVAQETFTPEYGNVYCDITTIDEFGNEQKTTGFISVYTLLEVCVKG